jgi:tetratricopeptide (TPR) repeat protein
MGAAYAALGEIDNAIECYQKAGAIDPRYAITLENLKLLKEI